MYRIAIVDDNEAWCFGLQVALQQHHFDVSTFTDAQEFLSVAHRFDLALVDFSMPTPLFKREIDGSQVIAQLKQRLEKPPTLVLVSAYFGKDCLEVAQQICPDADACLSKSSGLAKIVEFITALSAAKAGTKPVASARMVSNRQHQKTF